MSRYLFEFRPLVCRERDCDMTMVQDDPDGQIRYQHGENPEAVLELDRVSQGYVYAATAWAWALADHGDRMPPAELEDWVKRVHAYEDAARPATGEREGE